MKRFVNIINLLFIILILFELDTIWKPVQNGFYAVVLFTLIEVYYLLNLLFRKYKEKVKTLGDIIAILYSIIFIWELLTAKIGILDKELFPEVGNIIKLFISELPALLKGFVTSIELLGGGYILALVTAVPLALIIGWRKRLYRAVNPYTKVLGPIPPTVYIPYAIALLPTFKMSSIFIIFVGAFWPIFINTLNGVFNIDKNLIDSAKALNVGDREMLLEIILPGTIPPILSGATIGLTFSFILLTSAEMIGATSGMGWYVKYFSDFSDYPRVIVGILFIGIVVTGIMYILDRSGKYLLRWKKN